MSIAHITFLFIIFKNFIYGIFVLIEFRLKR